MLGLLKIWLKIQKQETVAGIYKHKESKIETAQPLTLLLLFSWFYFFFSFI